MPNMMPPIHQSQPDRIGVAIVYWGRQGAGAALMTEIAQAMSTDPRFEIFASPSRQSELPQPLADDRLLPIDTFSGVASLALRTLALPVVLKALVQRLAAARVQVVVTIMPHVWGLALQRAARRAGIRTVLIVHDADPHPGERRPVLDWLVRREMRRSDRVVTFSDHVADRLVARGDVQPDRLTRLYHPTFQFGPPQPREAPRHPPFRLLFFGRILPYKGLPLLLDAFARLRAAGVDCTLRVVGRGKIDAPPSLTRQQGLSIEQGWAKPEDIAGILAEADAVVLPYTEASQSGVIAAAYGAGLPVIATPVGGLAEQVTDGRTGVIADAATAADLATAIRRLIENPGLYEACRAGAAMQADAQSPRHFAQALGDVIALELTQASRSAG